MTGGLPSDVGEVKGRTGYRFAVLGSPVAHSLSPSIHRAMLDLSGLSGDYERIEADQRKLREIVAEMRAGKWNGLNITMPLKGAAAALSDQLGPTAARSGSVNTLVVDGDRIIGHSTDSVAFSGLFSSGPLARPTSVLILGAGGSAAAALTSVADLAPTYVSARRFDRARDLAVRLGGEPVAWDTPVAGAIVINCTPIGMRGELLNPDLLDVASGLIDLPYGPDPTPAVQRARFRNTPYVDGAEFLVRQAMASFRLWTGISVDLGAVQHRLRKI